MFPADIRVGYVFRYAYLWHRQYALGRREGEKDRPCLVLAIVKTDEAGNSVVRVLPITHLAPANPADALEIPQPVKRRLGMDGDQSWIVLTESNRFIWPGPDIRPVETTDGYYGPLPPALFAQVKLRFVALARPASHVPVPRGE